MVFVNIYVLTYYKLSAFRYISLLRYSCSGQFALAGNLFNLELTASRHNREIECVGSV